MESGMKPSWLFGVIVLVATSLSASAPAADLDRFIEAELAASAAPGIAYSQVDNNVVTARGFGKKKQGEGEPVTENTPFPIGSVTKSFTALAIMQLVEDGRLGLDDPISRHLTSFAGTPASNVTLRQLLNHTSGYSTVQGNSQHGNSDAATLTLSGYADELAAIVPVHPPGTVWEYSNANYQLLGAVIEQVSGQNYADYVRANIFEPLGMDDSAVLIGAPSPDVVTGHSPWFGGVRAIENSEGYAIHAPAGGIVASAQDMGEYLEMWLDQGDGIVTAKTKALMTSPSSATSPLYGLGWSLDPERGTVYHTGLVPGGETLVSFSHEQERGIAVMVNANGGLGFADTWYLIGGVGARALGQPHEDDRSRSGPRIAYLSIALLPPVFMLAMLVSWRGRPALRTKRESVSGKLSLWFPLVAMAALSAFLVVWLPRLFGGSVATLQIYQPDFAWCLILAAVLAPAWALARLALAYSGINKAAPTG